MRGSRQGQRSTGPLVLPKEVGVLALRPDGGEGGDDDRGGGADDAQRQPVIVAAAFGDAGLEWGVLGRDEVAELVGEAGEQAARTAAATAR